MDAAEARQLLHTFASPSTAKTSMGYFKTGAGQYGEGDQFIGVRVPDCRQVARKFRSLGLDEVDKLLASAVHEERLLALLILVYSVERSDAGYRRDVYEFYVARTKQVNNWDLVDTSAPAIVGGYLIDKSRVPLHRFAKSTVLWERRIAIVATQHFIRACDLEETLKIAELLLKDPADLIHKATGWMLREVGHKDVKSLEGFLHQHAASMPRTMLRYAIEKLPKQQQVFYRSIERQS